MPGVHTVAEIRAAEESLFEQVDPAVVMLRAATGIARTGAELLSPHRGRVYGARVVLLVGTGNNGGDGLVGLPHGISRLGDDPLELRLYGAPLWCRQGRN